MLRFVLLLTLYISSSEQNGHTILSTVSGNLHADPCAFSCTGVADRWSNSLHYRGRPYARVDVAGCGFISTPTLALMVTCTGKEMPDSVATKTTGQFEFLVYGDKGVSAEEAEHNVWVVNWSAIGYGCQ